MQVYSENIFYQLFHMLGRICYIQVGELSYLERLTCFVVLLKQKIFENTTGMISGNSASMFTGSTIPIKYIVSAVVKCYESSFYRTVDVTSQIQKALTLVASHLLTRHRDLNKNYHLQRCLTLTVHTTSRTSGEGGENSLIQGSFWKLILTIYRYCDGLSCFPFQSYIIGSFMIIV